MSSAYELSSFGYFTRASVEEMCNFCCRTFVTRTPLGLRQTVDYQGNACHIYVRNDGLAAIAISDKDYPDRVAYSLLNSLIANFSSIKENFVTDFPFLHESIAKYQDPTEADKLTKIQRELDLTKDVMHRNIDAVLNRGEKIDVLVDRSNDLNTQSKLFYKQASKLNSCCVVM